VERRRVVREKQIAFGDREVFTDAEGRRMSRLKEVPGGAGGRQGARSAH
jgi:hypothetical protein